MLSSRVRHLVAVAGGDIDVLGVLLDRRSSGSALAFVVCHLIGRAYGRTVLIWFGKYLGVRAEQIHKIMDMFHQAEWFVIPFFAGSNVVAAISGITRVSCASSGGAAVDRARRAARVLVDRRPHRRRPDRHRARLPQQVPDAGADRLGRAHRSSSSASTSVAVGTSSCEHARVGGMATVTLRGNPIHTSGELPEVGSQAPDFTVTGGDLGDITLDDVRRQEPDPEHLPQRRHRRRARRARGRSTSAPPAVTTPSCCASRRICRSRSAASAVRRGSRTSRPARVPQLVPRRLRRADRGRSDAGLAARSSCRRPTARSSTPNWCPRSPRNPTTTQPRRARLTVVERLAALTPPPSSR